MGRRAQNGKLLLVRYDVAQVFVSKHAACPFGAVGSVHAWERIGTVTVIGIGAFCVGSRCCFSAHRKGIFKDPSSTIR